MFLKLYHQIITYIMEIEQECSRSYKPDWMSGRNSNMDETTRTYLYGLLTQIESGQKLAISSWLFHTSYLSRPNASIESQLS